MRFRRAIWRAAGPVAGRVAPRPARAYYRAVVGSLVRALLRTPGVVAVYAHGSFAAAALRPGRSDVDLVAVVDDLDPAREVELLLKVGRPYRAHQAVLPIDLSILARSEFSRDAGWIAHRRRRIGPDEPIAPVADWLLLGGEEVREQRPWQPDSRLWYVTERHVLDGLAAWTHSPAELARTLGRLVRDVEREPLDWPAARRLVAAKSRIERVDGAAAAMHAALELIEADRRRRRLSLTSPPPGDLTRLPSPRAELAPAARRLASEVAARSATLYADPLEGGTVLLVEAETAADAGPLVRWALERGAAAAHRLGLALDLTTSLLAEDSWRTGFRWLAVAGPSRHLAGERLAPRVRLPEKASVADSLDFRAFSAGEVARSSLVGLRTMRRARFVLPQLELVRDLLAGAPPSPDPAGGDELDHAGWTRRAVELRRECASLVGKDDAFRPHPVSVD